MNKIAKKSETNLWGGWFPLTNQQKGNILYKDHFGKRVWFVKLETFQIAFWAELPATVCADGMPAKIVSKGMEWFYNIIIKWNIKGV